MNTHVPFMIPEEVRAPLNRIAVPQSIPANTVLFRLGDPVQGVYLIHSGTVALSLPNAVEPPRITGPGAVLGIPASIC